METRTAHSCHGHPALFQSNLRGMETTQTMNPEQALYIVSIESKRNGNK